MIKALSHLLYAIGLKPVPVPLSRGEPVHEVLVPVSKNPQTNGAAFAHDTVAGENRKEPAMAGIPEDAVQMPPPWAASPGLPPVDPVEGWCPSLSPTGMGGATRSAPSAAEARQGTDSGPTAGPGIPCDNIFEFNQGGEDAAPDPYQPFPDTVVPAPVRAGGMSPAGPAHDPLAERVEGHPGLAEIDVSDDGERALGSPQGSPKLFFQPVAAIGESALMAKLGALDSLGEAVSSRATVGVRRRVPTRIAARPDPTQWGDDELLTLPEAAALFWPGGPITTNTLRTAGRDGALAITKVAGKFFTTPMAIRRMGLDEVGEKPKQQKPDETSETSTLQMKIAEAQRLGGGRARSRRAARASVATAVTGGSGQ